MYFLRIVHIGEITGPNRVALDDPLQAGCAVVQFGMSFYDPVGGVLCDLYLR